MREIIAVDVGGTNARFARARLDANGLPEMGQPHKYKVADFASLADCWAAFSREEGTPLPRAAAIAFAAPIKAEQIKLTNSDWSIRPTCLADELGLEDLVLVNDFEAVAHAVSRLPQDHLPLLFGPEAPFPRDGAVTVLGPGTGLGVGLIAYRDGRPQVIATEGGHFDFAPLDALEDRLLGQLRGRFSRVSVERIVSGPGLGNVYRALAAIEGGHAEPLDDAALWGAALTGRVPLARTALERLCMSYGAAAGDLALAHGPSAVVLAGGLTARMRTFLGKSEFHARFVAKGRYENMMRDIPIRLALHDEIGLYGAAAAFGAKRQ